MRPKKLDKWLYLVPLFIGVLCIDMGTKLWVSKVFHLGESRAIIEGFFNFTLVFTCLYFNLLLQSH